MSLTQRVRDCRYSKGWGPDELANRAAISRTALYQIESGRTELPRAGTLRRIALALEVSMESLLGHGDELNGTFGGLPIANARKPRVQGDWLPSEGGPLVMPTGTLSPAPVTTRAVADEARFAVDALELSPPTPTSLATDSILSSRTQELTRKLHDLLSSPLGNGIAQIIEESYRLLPMMDCTH